VLKLPSSLTEKLEELKELYIIGKYQEAIARVDDSLKEDLMEKDRIEMLILQGKCLFQLYNLGLNTDFAQESHGILSKAFEISQKSGESHLAFIASYWLAWSLFDLELNEEMIPTIFDKLQKIYEEIEQTYPETKNLRKAMILHLEPIRDNILGKFDKFKERNQSHIQLRKEALNLLNEDKNLRKYDYDELRYYLNVSLGMHFRREENHAEALKYFNKAIEIAELYGNNYLLLVTLGDKARALRVVGNLDEYLVLIQEVIKKKERIGLEKGLNADYGYLGHYYHLIGEEKKFLECSLKARSLCTIFDKDAPSWLDNIGIAYYSLGDYDKALETFEKSYELSKKSNWLWGIYSSQENLGLVYYLKGEIDKAIKLQEESGEFFETNDRKLDLAFNRQMISSSYLKKGLINKAIQSLEHALSLYKEANSSLHVIHVLFNLVNVTSTQDMMKQAEQYLQELSLALEDSEFPKLKRLGLLAEGIILRNSSDSRDRVKAEVIFEQLLNEDLAFGLRIETLFHQCNLLLEELKSTGNQNVLNKLNQYIDKLLQIATEKNLVALLIETMWFKAQLLFLEEEYEEAKSILSQASALAEEKGYNHLALKINSSKDEIITRLIDLEDDVKSSLSLTEKMDILKLKNRFEEVKETQVFAITELQLKSQF